MVLCRLVKKVQTLWSCVRDYFSPVKSVEGATPESSLCRCPEELGGVVSSL